VIILAIVVRRKDEDINVLIKRFRKKYQEEGIQQELKRREFYLSPAQKRRRKSELAQARLRKKSYVIIEKEDGYNY